MPASSRVLTTSRASIRLTGKCLPMSRRKSIVESVEVQSWLLTMVAALSPSKPRNGSTCARTRSVQSFTVSSELSVRSPESLGSPIMPVAPPTSAYGVCPVFWSRRAVTSWTRLPMWRLGAVGSKPT